MRAHNFKDLSGQTFGKWTVSSIYEMRQSSKGKKRTCWFCTCECGNQKFVISGQLTYGSTTQCKSCAVRGVVGESARNTLLCSYKGGAKQRGLSWNLSEEKFDSLTKSDCHYCGIAPYRHARTQCHNGDYVYNGIDRVDNSRGYEPDNVVSCCRICNRAKDTMTVEEFLSWIERIHMKAKTAESHEFLLNQKQKPQTVGVSGPGPFKGTRAGEKRAGSTKYLDYPGELTSNPAYKGGVGDCK